MSRPQDAARVRHACVCLDWSGTKECECGVYEDEHGRWCANENCRAFLDKLSPVEEARSCESTGKIGTPPSEMATESRANTSPGKSGRPNEGRGTTAANTREVVQALAEAASFEPDGATPEWFGWQALNDAKRPDERSNA